jgi:hypothetical protein
MNLTFTSKGERILPEGFAEFVGGVAPAWPQPVYGNHPQYFVGRCRPIFRAFLTKQCLLYLFVQVGSSG